MRGYELWSSQVCEVVRRGYVSGTFVQDVYRLWATDDGPKALESFFSKEYRSALHDPRSTTKFIL